ncbi:MAG: hypothetical protein ACNJA3_28720 (plasmid) [Pseudomonas rhizophila]|uniref:hypothetical protein n=1 Tax=Pseudomonas rhizophila TaxID=2045200 RepID=UPI003F6AE51F
MNVYDIAWNVLCYLAAFAGLIFFALWMMTEMRVAKARRQDLFDEQQAQAKKATSHAKDHE